MLPDLSNISTDSFWIQPASLTQNVFVFSFLLHICFPSEISTRLRDAAIARLCSARHRTTGVRVCSPVHDMQRNDMDDRMVWNLHGAHSEGADLLFVQHKSGAVDVCVKSITQLVAWHNDLVTPPSHPELDYRKHRDGVLTKSTVKALWRLTLLRLRSSTLNHTKREITHFVFISKRNTSPSKRQFLYLLLTSCKFAKIQIIKIIKRQTLGVLRLLNVASVYLLKDLLFLILSSRWRYARKMVFSSRIEYNTVLPVHWLLGDANCARQPPYLVGA